MRGGIAMFPLCLRSVSVFLVSTWWIRQIVCVCLCVRWSVRVRVRVDLVCRMFDGACFILFVTTDRTPFRRKKTALSLSHAGLVVSPRLLLPTPPFCLFSRPSPCVLVSWP